MERIRCSYVYVMTSLSLVVFAILDIGDGKGRQLPRFNLSTETILPSASLLTRQLYTPVFRKILLSRLSKRGSPSLQCNLPHLLHGQAQSYDRQPFGNSMLESSRRTPSQFSSVQFAMFSPALKARLA